MTRDGSDEANVPLEEALTRLARHVQLRRMRLGLSQEQVAANGGPSSRAIRDIEGRRMLSPTPSMLAKLDRGLNWPSGVAAMVWEGTSGYKDMAKLSDPGKVEAEDSATLTEHATVTEIPPTTWSAAPRPPVVLVAELIARLAQEQQRTPAAEDALASLHRLLPELWAHPDAPPADED